MTTDPKYENPLGAQIEGPMDADGFKSNVWRLVNDANQFVRDEISWERERNWRYWNGECDLKAKKHRTKMVSTDVYDIVEATVPQLAKIFSSNEGVVEFRAKKPEDVAFCREATQACNYTFRSAGWTKLVDWLRDGLVAKSSVWKFFRTNERSVTFDTLEGFSLDEFYAFLANDRVEREVMAIEGNTDVGPVSVHTRTSKTAPGYLLEAVPPEQFLINRQASSADDAWIIGQRTIVRVSDCVAMGIPKETAIQLRSTELEDSELRQEREARRRYVSREESTATYDEASWPVNLYDLYVRIDQDGDGYAELHHVIAAGDNVNEIVYNEVVNDHPYVVCSPIRVPHTAIGRSQADIVIDLQDQNTFTLRQILDNLAWANNPRQWYLEGQVDEKAMEDNRFGGMVGVNRPDAIGTLGLPFVAHQSMPILEYLKERRQFRTGISDESMGINAEALQSSTEIGVRAVLGQAQVQVEMIARTLAEDGLKPLFEKMLRTFIAHGDMVPYVSDGRIMMFSASTTPDMDVKVKVGLGTGQTDEKLAALQQIYATQKEIMMAMGPNNPFVTVGQIAATLTKMVTLSPISGAAEHFNPPEIAQQWQAPPKQDPEMMKIQAKQQTDMAKIQSDFNAKVLKIQMDAQADRMEAATEAATELKKALIQAQQDATEAEMKSMLKQHELMLEGIMEKYKIDMKVEADTRLRAVND